LNYEVGIWFQGLLFRIQLVPLQRGKLDLATKTIVPRDDGPGGDSNSKSGDSKSRSKSKYKNPKKKDLFEELDRFLKDEKRRLRWGCTS
jgi:hypothetical protein